MDYGLNVMQNSLTDARLELQFPNRFLEFLPGYVCPADMHNFISWNMSNLAHPKTCKHK